MNTQPESLRLAHVADHPIPPDWIDMVAAVRDLLRLHAENEALQQVYDATQLEIDHLRGVTKMVAPAQPVAWLVYLPSIDTQNVYDSQDDPGYVDDVTNHADAEVTPLYEMAAPKAEVAPAGEYPPSVAYTELPDFDTVEQRIYAGCRRFISRDMLEPIHGLIREAIDADRAARAPADSVLEDAARYRFLAARCRITGEHWGGRWSIVVEGPAPESHDSKDDFDAAIDAARSQAKEGDPQ